MSCVGSSAIDSRRYISASSYSLREASRFPSPTRAATCVGSRAIVSRRCTSSASTSLSSFARRARSKAASASPEIVDPPAETDATASQATSAAARRRPPHMVASFSRVAPSLVARATLGLSGVSSFWTCRRAQTTSARGAIWPLWFAREPVGGNASPARAEGYRKPKRQEPHNPRRGADRHTAEDHDYASRRTRDPRGGRRARAPQSRLAPARRARPRRRRPPGAHGRARRRDGSEAPVGVGPRPKDRHDLSQHALAERLRAGASAVPVDDAPRRATGRRGSEPPRALRGGIGPSTVVGMGRDPAAGCHVDIPRVPSSRVDAVDGAAARVHGCRGGRDADRPRCIRGFDR
mmetsp:Transcript_20181/g.60277  ORF Transcript_20181/g.60277 Transcript_20181/m.60277 type:complete len:350 (-) Transcript_20181:1147-2196(-)